MYKKKLLQLKKTYRSLFLEFLNNSAISGLKVLRYQTPHRYGRPIWIVFIAMAIVWTHFAIINLALEYIRQPTVVRASTSLTHVANSPFPGVAICSANKISQSKLLDFAEKVFLVQEAYKPQLLASNISDMAIQLQVLVGFYLNPYDDYHLGDERLEKLQEIFVRMYNTTEYPMVTILLDLAPSCKNLVLKGVIYGAPINTHLLFEKRMTTRGVCCIFNYQRDGTLMSEDAINEYKKIKFETNSILNSVDFVLQDDPSDYTYQEFNTSAFQIYIFPQADYPAVQSNSNGEVIVNYNALVEVPIQLQFYVSNENIMEFPPETRQCYFPEEGQKLLNKSYYSLDECLLICRIQSMINYCGCIAPSLPLHLMNAPVCGVNNLPCLTQWKRVWNGWNFFDYVNEEEEPTQVKVSTPDRCPLCMQTCSGLSFKVIVNELPIRKPEGTKYEYDILNGTSSSKPVAIIKMYFKELYVQATEKGIVSDWVDLLNMFGGILSIIYGFSIISYIEIVYYLTGKWLTYIIRAIQYRRQSIPRKSVYSLYWQELGPKYMNISPTEPEFSYSRKYFW